VLVRVLFQGLNIKIKTVNSFAVKGLMVAHNDAEKMKAERKNGRSPYNYISVSGTRPN